MKAETMIDNGLNARQVLILERLAGGAKHPADITSDKLSKMNITGLVDKLIIKELVTRDHDTEDRRKVVLGITDKGRRLLAK